MQYNDSLPSNKKKNDEFDIQEVENPSCDIDEIDGEVTEWKSLEIERLEIVEKKEQVHIRSFLVYSTMSLWGIWTIVALITLNRYLIVASPPMPILLKKFIDYYFPVPTK